MSWDKYSTDIELHISRLNIIDKPPPFNYSRSWNYFEEPHYLTEYKKYEQPLQIYKKPIKLTKKQASTLVYTKSELRFIWYRGMMSSNNKIGKTSINKLNKKKEEKLLKLVSSVVKYKYKDREIKFIKSLLC
jgi:hypothetical protein